MSEKELEASCGAPERVLKEFALSIVTAEAVRAESDAESLV